MFESLNLFLWWAISTYIIVQIVIGVQNSLKKSTNLLHQKLFKQLDEIVHRVRVEKDRDTYYWYDLDNNKFLAQGRSDEEIVVNLKTRFPTHMFFLPTNHLICANTNWQPKIIKQQLTDNSQ
jgi:hypothetical protein